MDNNHGILTVYVIIAFPDFHVSGKNNTARNTNLAMNALVELLFFFINQEVSKTISLIFES